MPEFLDVGVELPGLAACLVWYHIAKLAFRRIAIPWSLRRLSPPSPASSFRWLTAILVCGFVLRLGSPGSLGIDHFDEGVYASAGESLFASVPNLSIDPGIIPYGPPLVAIPIAFSDFLLGGASDIAAILPGILFGTAAVFLAWRLSRMAFGDSTALATAALVATSGMEIAFSRSALTESVFAATWLFAMLAGARFLRRPGLAGASLLGISVGLAQLTKYNGGMTGLIVALTAVLEFLLVSRGTPGNSGLFRRRILWGIFAAILAAAIYAPWFLFVEDHGGYRELMRHHGSYVDGPGRWLANARLQLAQGWVFQAQPVALVCCALVLIALRPSSGGPAGPWDFARTLGLVALPNAPLFASLISIRRTWHQCDIAGRMIVVWLLTMLLTTPLYHPYARLWLPGHLASLMLAANFVFSPAVRRESDTKSEAAEPASRIPLVVCLLAFAGLTLLSVDLKSIPGFGRLPTVWSDRTNLRAEIAARVENIRQVTARGQAVHLLLNPAGRRALALELGNRPPGPGRLIVVENLSKWNARNGPIMIDLSLVDPNEARQLSEVSRETEATDDFENGQARSRRGLITTLDLAPGVALGEKLPPTGIVWQDR